MAKFSEKEFRGGISELAEAIRTELAASDTLSFRDWCLQASPQFRWDWPHLAFIRQRLESRTEALAECLQGRTSEHRPRHLILSVPPRHGKSEQVTIRYPAYLLERWPRLRVIQAAYNAKLATKFSRKTRRIAAERMPLSAERNAADDWETMQEGGVRAVGVGGGVTGHGAHLILIDDPVKSREEAESEAYRERCWDWFCDDLYTRLEPGGVIVLIMTRWHEDDLVGRIKASDFADDFEVINLCAEAEYGDPLGRPLGAALCPDRFDEAALARLRLVLGRSYNALYQGRPVAAEGDIIRLAWFRRFKHRPQNAFRIVQSWDTAQKAGVKNDYSTCGTYYETPDGYFLVDLLRERLEYPKLKQRFFEKAERWNPDAILVEDKGHGTALGQEARAPRKGKRWRVVMIDPEGDKVTRMSVESAALEGGLVWLPESAPWLPDFEDECAHFPAVAHDDQVDQLSQFLRWARNPDKKRADYRAWSLPWA